MNSPQAAQYKTVPVAYRYRHSETEKWHYGEHPQNWWECQALALAASPPAPASQGLTWDDALRIARGCTDYGGGYRGNEPLYEAYQHGIQTVVTALLHADPQDSQTRALLAMGGDAQQQPTQPENIRTGQPYHDPAFEQLAREHDVWGRASSALCAVFWMAGKQQVAQGWQDIATAPKDGTEIIVFHPEAGVCAAFCPGEGFAWHCMDGMNTVVGAKSGQSIPRMTSFMRSPTHWIPLPPAPGAEPAQGQDARDGDG